MLRDIKIAFQILPTTMTQQEEHNRILDYVFACALSDRDAAFAKINQNSPVRPEEDVEDTSDEVTESNNCVVLIDGAVTQVKYMDNPEVYEKFKDKRVAALKSPASTTGVLAANDVMKGHGNFRRAVQSRKEYYSLVPDEKD